MALMDFIKKQFIDVIHWTEEGDGILATRYPMQDMEIQYGAQLTVRDSQIAVFVNEGQVADVFGPGRYTLTTRTLPVLTYLKNWDKLFESPFKSEVYFFSSRLQLDHKWGTSNPITLRDQDFGMVRMRAFGIYSYQLNDAKKFYSEISGTRAEYTVDDLDGQLRNLVISSMTDLFAESGVPFIDMAANQDELSRALKGKLDAVFERYGLLLDRLVVQNVSLPEELQKVLDTRIGMNMIGDLGRYTQYQVASSIPLAAENEGGIAGIGAGLGAGLGIGQTMTTAMGSAMQPGAVPAGQLPVAGTSPLGVAAPLPASPLSADEVVATLEKLYALVGKGILSQAEFDAKKAELLGKLV
jgi:membrane protease subunit (stomatin/prohibitin family)